MVAQGPGLSPDEQVKFQLSPSVIAAACSIAEIQNHPDGMMIKPLVLIVEDDPSLNQIFADTLQENFEIVSCNDGDSALQQLTQITPHLVLLDLHLPGANGSKILSYIRAADNLRDVIVILCTADERQAEFLRDQADFVLLKPISPIQLLQLTSRLK